MPTQPTLCPTNTHTNKKDTICLMTSAHSTSSPHNLFSNSHHDECTSFLITQLPKNKRKFIPKVLKVHINQMMMFYLMLLRLTVRICVSVPHVLEQGSHFDQTSPCARISQTRVQDLQVD